MNKLGLIITFVLLFPSFVFTQNFLEKHKTYLKEQQYDALEFNLQEWEQSKSCDETFYITHLNFYFLKSKNSIYYTNKAK